MQLDGPVITGACILRAVLTMLCCIVMYTVMVLQNRLLLLHLACWREA